MTGESDPEGEGDLVDLIAGEGLAGVVVSSTAGESGDSTLLPETVAVAVRVGV